VAIRRAALPRLCYLTICTKSFNAPNTNVPKVMIPLRRSVLLAGGFGACWRVMGGFWCFVAML